MCVLVCVAALARRTQGKYEEAIADYSQALSIDPHHFKAVYNRAFSYDKVTWRL